MGFSLQTCPKGTFDVKVIPQAPDDPAGGPFSTVVPDSGTDQPAGLAGRMTIIIAEGKHSYEFAYTLGSAGQ